MVQSSWTIGQVSGIPIKVHVSLLLLAPAAILLFDKPSLLTRIIVILVWPVLMLLHELGHSLVARRCRCATSEILLTAVGGFAHLYQFDRNPRHMVRIALAGPAVSLVLAMFMLLFRSIFYEAHELVREIFWWLFLVAGVPGALSLLPGLPLDGGLALRGLISDWVGYRSATLVTVWIGRLISGVAVVYGLTHGRIGLLIAVMAAAMFIGAEREWRSTK